MATRTGSRMAECDDCGGAFAAAELVRVPDGRLLCAECESVRADWTAGQARIDRAAAAGHKLNNLWD